MRKTMIQKVIAFMEKHNMIAEHDLVAAGVSGGADSLCLLFVLLEYQKKVPFDLVVVHVDHGIRKEAFRDADFVRDICDRQNIPFFLKKADVRALAKEQHLSEEEAGRKVRYEAFEEALQWYREQMPAEMGANRIAVAHHQGDLAETTLFHLFRGTGIYGMSGILPVKGNVIRPLLACSRNQIEDFLTKRDQSWCMDYTNEEDTYTRNKIRHHILGYADKEINERATEHVAKAATQMASLREYLECEVAKMLDRIAEVRKDGISINIGELQKYPELLQSQFLLTAIDSVAPGRRDISSKHLQDISELFEKAGTKRLDLPGNLQVIKEYGTLRIKMADKKPVRNKEAGKEDFRPEEKKEDVQRKQQSLEPGNSYVLNDGSLLEISLINVRDLEGIEENKYTKYFDYDKIKSHIMLRYRQTGDYLTINDQGQKKSLKDYFINEKVPAFNRDHIPLIADGNHILWIIGYRISAYYKVTSETTKIIQMTLRRSEHGRNN